MVLSVVVLRWQDDIDQINTWKYPWSTGYLWKIYQIPFQGIFDKGDSIFYGLVQRTKRNFI